MVCGGTRPEGGKSSNLGPVGKTESEELKKISLL